MKNFTQLFSKQSIVISTYFFISCTILMAPPKQVSEQQIKEFYHKTNQLRDNFLALLMGLIMETGDPNSYKQVMGILAGNPEKIKAQFPDILDPIIKKRQEALSKIPQARIDAFAAESRKANEEFYPIMKNERTIHNNAYKKRIEEIEAKYPEIAEMNNTHMSLLFGSLRELQNNQSK